MKRATNEDVFYWIKENGKTPEVYFDGFVSEKYLKVKRNISQEPEVRTHDIWDLFEENVSEEKNVSYVRIFVSSYESELDKEIIRLERENE